MTYQEQIKAIVPDANPRHVEAYMRLTYRTLDALSSTDFADAATVAASEVQDDGPDVAESVAETYGLGDTDAAFVEFAWPESDE